MCYARVSQVSHAECPKCPKRSVPSVPRRNYATRSFDFCSFRSFHEAGAHHDVYICSGINAMAIATNRIYVLAILTTHTAKFTVPILIQISDSSTGANSARHSSAVKLVIFAPNFQSLRAQNTRVLLYVTNFKQLNLLVK